MVVVFLRYCTCVNFLISFLGSGSEISSPTKCFFMTIIIFFSFRFNQFPKAIPSLQASCNSTTNKRNIRCCLKAIMPFEYNMFRALSRPPSAWHYMGMNIYDGNHGSWSTWPPLPAPVAPALTPRLWGSTLVYSYSCVRSHVFRVIHLISQSCSYGEESKIMYLQSGIYSNVFVVIY